MDARQERRCVQQYNNILHMLFGSPFLLVRVLILTKFGPHCLWLQWRRATSLTNKNLPFADRPEAGLEDGEGEGGGRGDYSQREEKSAAQLKRGIVINVINKMEHSGIS